MSKYKKDILAHKHEVHCEIQSSQYLRFSMYSNKPFLQSSFGRLQIFWTVLHGQGLVQASWMLLLKVLCRQENQLVDLR